MKRARVTFENGAARARRCNDKVAHECVETGVDVVRVRQKCERVPAPVTRQMLDECAHVPVVNACVSTQRRSTRCHHVGVELCHQRRSRALLQQLYSFIYYISAYNSNSIVI